MATTTEGNPPNIDINQREHIQYTIEMDQTITQLAEGLHNSDNPEEILQQMLVAVTEFYDGDWASIMEADLTMKIWFTSWWYNRNTGGMTPNHFADLEDVEYLWRWIDSMTKGTPMVIEDVEAIKEISPMEYSFLKTNGFKSMLAVPFWKRPTGFLIVRNPKRYIHCTSVLKALAFVAVSSINEKCLMDSTKLNLIPDIIKRDTDIVINLFDHFQIITSKGVLVEAYLKFLKMVSLIVYLLLNKRSGISSLEIFHNLWPNEDNDRTVSNVKVLVYRLQQAFSLISDYRLIESSKRGYRINPELNIITDTQIIEEYWNQAQITADISSKGYLLKKAMDIYKHGILSDLCGELWLMPTVAHYSLRYIGVINQLLCALDKANDYVWIHEYANIAIQSVPGSADAYYWLIYAMQHLGTPEIARNELHVANCRGLPRHPSTATNGRSRLIQYTLLPDNLPSELPCTEGKFFAFYSRFTKDSPHIYPIFRISPTFISVLPQIYFGFTHGFTAAR